MRGDRHRTDLPIPENGVMTDKGVFMFAENGLRAFPTAEDAAAGMEWVDVESGDVYEAFFDTEGQRLMPEQGQRVQVRLVPSGEVDVESLKSLLRREHGTFTGDPDDPVAVANEMLATERAWRWSRRWPRWPRWLDVRLHGSTPPGA
jgi:hypothetical protein